jgi:hypothetical protein
MPIIIKSTYSKKLGLPGYSSHSYSLTVETELTDISQLDRQSAQLYATLQASVDRELQETGFCPDGNGSSAPRTTNSRATDHPRSNGHTSQTNGDQWACSDKQRDLIKKIVDEHKLDKQEVEGLAKDMFNAPVKSLNKLQASGIIEELLEKYGPKNSTGNGNGGRSFQRGGRR